MPIEMPRGLPFAVDTWSAASGQKRHRFLTHAHRDHLVGIASRAFFPVYATRLTILLSLHYFPLLDRDSFVEIEIGTPVVVADPDGGFTVTAYDANHCPGAVMFLFEGEFGNILHAGDCRLTPDCLHSLPMKYIAKGARETMDHIDHLFLDCTFGRCPLQFPSKKSAIQQVINCIWKQPSAPVVYLACDLLGQEEILDEVSRTFGSKIYVDKASNSECYHALSHTAPEILTDDASSRFQVIGFPKLSERASEKLAVARASHQPEPLFIRPSTQWYANYSPAEASQMQKPNLAEAERDGFGVWHVCFSIHSSREELEWALQLLRPKWVISTTPPCLAMELAYVKHHCFRTRLAPGNPLWKLLGIPQESPAATTSLPPPLTAVAIEATENNGGDMSCAEQSASDSDLVRERTPMLKDLEIKPEQPVTLFGRARFGPLQESESWEDGNSDKSAEAIKDAKFSGADVALFLDKDGTSATEDKIGAESKQESSAPDASTECDAPPSENGSSSGVAERVLDVSCVGSSKGFSASLRSLYRSMNVPVPRPLPSLAELMGASKRVKVTP